MITRRNSIKTIGLGLSGAGILSAENQSAIKTTPVVTALHLTDVHFNLAGNVPERFRHVLRHIRKEHPSVQLVLNTGDIVDGKPSPDAMGQTHQLWKKILREELEGVTILSALGNHDFDHVPAADDAPWGRNEIMKSLDLPSRYYDAASGGWHFIALDSTRYGGDADQQEWLHERLNGIPAETPVAILSHHPVFSGTGLLYPKDMIGKWKDLTFAFARHSNVRLVLSGHMHLYEQCLYNGVSHVCGGALSGHWWDHTKPYHQTWAGYGLLQLHADGTSNYQYRSLRSVIDPTKTAG